MLLEPRSIRMYVVQRNHFFFSCCSMKGKHKYKINDNETKQHRFKPKRRQKKCREKTRPGTKRHDRETKATQCATIPLNK